ncbi:ARPP-2 domain-containing protein [Pendulispora albinea]|uniref:ARG and Rhodanese-Phosphatase-superfamily-associated domain-containing protein n=1 Tax=Pendulispora albinea TaxID=2741071 RepID=A0ABZ2M078_9BACT
MMKTAKLALTNLRTGSPQTLGAIRLVPICRDRAPGDLRIRLRDLVPAPAIVSLDGAPGEPGLKYVSYVPHGLVVAHTKDGAQASFGTTLGEERGARGRCVNLLHRMVKREDDVREGATSTARFRLLPLHLAMEGFLAHHFGGPDIAWSEYSQHAIRRGLDPRAESSVRGRSLPGFEAALRVFEMHPTQVGVMIFVADALASVFVVSHPSDYRLLHRSVLEDFFGQLVYEYGLLYPETPPIETPLHEERIASISDLRAEVARARGEWEEYARLLADGLFRREVRVETVRSMAPFRLERFMPDFDPDEECHLGERIVRDDGTVEYMKTFRLSAAQVRRAHLLEQLARAGWNLGDAAARLRCTRDELVKRLDNAGFGYLLAPHVLRASGTAP